MELLNTTKCLEQEKPAPYSWVKEAMKRANDKYRRSHLELTAEKQRKYYERRKDDESFKKMQREKALRYYYKKKERKENESKKVKQRDLDAGFPYLELY